MLGLSPQELLQELKPVFYPRSIAIIGASPKSQNAGSGWVFGLVASGFSGGIYPVNPRGGEMFGLKVYPSLASIPAPVDYVIVSIPREAVPGLLDECIAKKIRAIHFFTAGYSELGDTTSNKMENELMQKARRGDFHIIGPNCIGNFCTESKIPLSPMAFMSEIGTVSFISQSGGMGAKLAESGIARGLKFNKGINFGNGIDLDGIDFLRYMGADPKTSIIGAYFEGARNGRQLLNTMREVSKVKPIVVLKGGRTEVGAAAAKSHTGSLASPVAIWSAAVKQSGVIEVRTIEELTDTLLIFQQLGSWLGKNIAIAGGLADGGGGISVTAGDICSEVGLTIPQLSSQTKEKLTKLLGLVGSILHNPVDVSQAGSSPPILEEAFSIILADPTIDMLIVQEDMGILLRQLDKGSVETVNNSLVKLKDTYNKPVVIVLPPGLNEPERLQTEHKLAQDSIPIFPTMERAARAILRLSRYSQFRATLRN